MKTPAILGRSLSLGWLLLAVLCFGPCVEQRTLENALAGFQVDITSVSGAVGGSGTAADPYDYPAGEVTLTIDAQAFDLHGQRYPFEGDCALRATPGELANPAQRVAFSDGQVQGATVRVRRVFGSMALWVEDLRWVTGDLVQGKLWGHQLIEPEGSFAAGISNLIHFNNPTLRRIQWDPWLPDIDYSSLAEAFVEADCRKDQAGPLPQESAACPGRHGQLVVTGITSDGFFATDLVDQGLGYNHLFVYSYSYPEDLKVGYRLDALSGSAQEFSGDTQISFPLWKRAEDPSGEADPCRVPDLDAAVPPTTITPQMCDAGGTTQPHLCGYSKQNWELEALESARVQLTSILAPDLYINCDFNRDLELVADWLDANHPEARCQVACLERNGQTQVIAKEIVASQRAMLDLVDPTPVVCPWEADIPGIQPNCRQLSITMDHVCSELSTLRQYGQWTAALDTGNGPLINLVTRDSLPSFDPADPANLGRVVDTLRGNLRYVRAARPRWMLMVGTEPNDTPDWMRTQ